MTNFEMVVAAIIGVLSVARTARLVVWDEYPPMVWLRMKWDEKWGEDGWGKLIHCQFCATPYMAVGMALWFWASDGHWTWWVINGVWGLSYVSAIIVAYDDGPA